MNMSELSETAKWKSALRFQRSTFKLQFHFYIPAKFRMFD